MRHATPNPLNPHRPQGSEPVASWADSLRGATSHRWLPLVLPPIVALTTLGLAQWLKAA